MKQDLEHFIDERAERLALVYLTRCQDLAIERLIKAEYGLELLVTILRDQLPTGRVFGVQVKGRDKAFKNIQQEALLSLSERERNYFQDLPFPVCLLFFTMDDDKGYYKWLKYSSESSQNVYPLELNQWRALDEDPVGQLLKEVNAWYDEKSHSAA